jgi:hypothetical protein
MRKQLNRLEQSRFNKVHQISGVNSNDLERDLRYGVINLCAKYGISIDSSQIVSAKAKRINASNGPIELIHVEFDCEEVLFDVLKQKKVCKSADGVFFNQLLSPLNRELLSEAIKLKKSGKVGSVWVYKGMVTVRAKPNQNPMRIFCVDDIEKGELCARRMYPEHCLHPKSFQCFGFAKSLYLQQILGKSL